MNNQDIINVDILKQIQSLLEQEYRKFETSTYNIFTSSYLKNNSDVYIKIMSNNLEKIYTNAFYGCENLSKVFFNNEYSSPRIFKDAFSKVKEGISFYVKNQKIADELLKELKFSGVKNANIYVGETLAYSNVD